jgi:pimeloyl-ACP methyl ester carboxylesterase
MENESRAMSTQLREAFSNEYAGFEPATVVAPDGFPLRVWECGSVHAPRVVIINPIGVPLVIGARLARELAESYRVICFEQRGYESELEGFVSRPHDFSVFVSDLIEVISQRGDPVCALIGICTGAAQAIRAIASGALTAELVLISPLVRLAQGYVKGGFDRGPVNYYSAIAQGDLGLAQGVLEFRAASVAQPRALSPDEQMIDAAEAASLKSIDSICAYSKAVYEFARERFDDDLRSIQQPVLVISSVDDKTVAMDSVRKLCSLLPSGQLEVYPSGGHYLIYTNREARLCVRRWLAMRSGARATS